MIFSSITFLYFFLPAVLICYYAVPVRFKNLILLTASIIFYAWGEKLLVLLFLFSIITGWLSGLLIEKHKGTVKSKIIFILSLIFDIGVLLYFKYTDFFILSINQVSKLSIPLLKIALPIGISFYTFQLISYKVDVYKNKVEAQKDFISFALYIAMFPQLIAGPIVRYSDIQLQLKERSHSLSKIYSGIRRFIIGFSKKIFIANILGEISVIFKASDDLSVLYYWLYAVSFMLQIYYDFSGYSDMAIGLGKIFGFDFIENFNYPYISKSITEFWRRWHISLGSWFRDYVYIPLGGNKKGLLKQFFNIAVVWFLTGMWHGASWNFILWGIFFAVLLVIEKMFLKKILDKSRVLSHIYTLFFVLTGFVIFNASSLGEIITELKGMSSFGKIPLISREALYYLKSNLIVLVAAIIGSTPLFSKLYKKLSESRLSKAVLFIEPLLLILLFVTGTAFIVDGSFNPFLYFRF